MLSHALFYMYFDIYTLLKKYISIFKIIIKLVTEYVLKMKLHKNWNNHKFVQFSLTVDIILV